MKEINFDHNNIGGLALVYAFPPSDLLRVRYDYRSGKHYVEMKTRDNIVAIPVYPDRSFVFDEQKSTADGGGIIGRYQLRVSFRSFDMRCHSLSRCLSVASGLCFRKTTMALCISLAR